MSAGRAVTKRRSPAPTRTPRRARGRAGDAVRILRRSAMTIAPTTPEGRLLLVAWDVLKTLYGYDDEALFVRLLATHPEVRATLQTPSRSGPTDPDHLTRR